MTQDDVEAADAVARVDAVSARRRAPTSRRCARGGRRRIAHLQQTDPGGCFVAVDDDGAIAGVSLALIRESIWGYSLFAVAEHVHGRGLGRELFAAVLGLRARRARGHLILSTEHPAAMRLYATSGLPLLPCVAAAGIADLTRAPDLHAPSATRAPRRSGRVDAIGRELRGAGHGARPRRCCWRPGRGC